MSRTLSMMKLDAIIQFRNKFYYVGIGLSLLLALLITQFFQREQMGDVLPLFFLFAVGGTTLIYVAGLVIFEKGEHTLDAVLVSPLRLDEYMLSKIVTLTLIATLESVIVIALSVGFTGYSVGLVLLGVVLMGAMMVPVGVIMIVRYDSVTDFLMPVLIVSLILQLPFLYFIGINTSPIWFLIPTAAPTLLMWGGWHTLETWQLVYGVGYSLLWLAGVYVWAKRAFYHHIILGGRNT